jgi:hypothetical protein
MVERETAYSETKNPVIKFKNMPAQKLKGLNEMEARLDCTLPILKALKKRLHRAWLIFYFTIVP